jgi:hypothetical protein
LDILRRRVPGRRWLQFSAAVEERHLAAFVRSAPKRREQGHGLGAGVRALATVPPRLGSDDVTQAPPIPAAPAVDRGFDAPAIADRSWPRHPLLQAAADRAVPGWELRAAAAGRSLAADPHDPEAGTRADHDRVDERLIAGALQGFAQTLEPQVQGYLSRLLDLRIPAVRIHTGQAADAAARRLNADAVSFGRSIMFRAGKFDPDSAAGLGLLGHELTHVAQAAGAESDRSAGARGRAALARDELAAIENERRLLQHARWQPVAPARPPAAPREPTSRAPKVAAPPRAAAVDRGVAAARPEGVSSAPEFTPQQLGALQEAIYRDLMDRIRTEFERGA